jgi:hypothetical protein
MDADVQSFSTARLAALVVQIAHNMSGAKGPAPKVTAKDYLPFGQEAQLSTAADGPSEATKLVLIDVMKRGEIPPAVFHSLYAPAPLDQE